MSRPWLALVFLALVGCDDPKVATAPAADAGIRVVNYRIGIVLTRKGGALALMWWPFNLAMGGKLGMNIDLARIATDKVDREDVILFSESAGRFIVTINPAKQEAFERMFKGTCCARIGIVTEQPDFVVQGLGQDIILNVPLADLKSAWKKTFGELI